MATNWTAGSSRRSTLLQGGRFIPVVVIPYTTTWGDDGEVEIPVAQFTAERAGEMIQAEVDELEKLRAL